MNSTSPFFIRVQVTCDRRLCKLRSVRCSSQFRTSAKAIRANPSTLTHNSLSSEEMPHARYEGTSYLPSPSRRTSRRSGSLEPIAKLEVISLPPSLQRFICAPTTRIPASQLKTVLRLTHEDLENVVAHGNSIVLRPQQSSSKTPTKYNFDHIFPPDATQQQVCSVCLPDLLQSYFSGSDACLLYFGAVSKAKSELLYSRARYSSGPSQDTPSSYPGLFPSALLLTFRLISEFRERRPDFRHSVRISALYYSQRNNLLSDLLAPLINDSRPEVTISEDSALGIKIENHCEIRVDTPEEAMRYLNEVINSRMSGEENEQRCAHLFFYINLYRYKTDSTQVIGGRSRLCLIDLGLGERSSKGDAQALTMPVITNLLVALFQGQRHLPSRQSPLCMLLKDSLGNVRSKSSLLFASLSDRASENENIVQMMAKIQRAAKPRKTTRMGSDCSSSESVRRRIAVDSEGNSSSEQSCAETVIFLGPSIRSEPMKPTPKKECSNAIDVEKRKMIMQWMEGTKYETSEAVKVSVEVQCNEEDIDFEMQDYPCHRQLDDIIEDDEESFTHSSREISVVDHFLETFHCGEELAESQIDHPLSILSLDKFSASPSAKGSSENEVEDDDLERAMAASVSSIRSHEILSRLNDDLPSEQTSCSDSSSGMGIYRKASHLEAYAEEKLRSIDTEANEKKKKKKLTTLNCCQSSMISSGSSAGVVQTPITKCTVEISGRKRNGSPAAGVVGQRTLDSSSIGNAFVPSLAAAVTRKIAQQVNNGNFKLIRGEALQKSKLPRRTDGNFSISGSPSGNVRSPEFSESPNAARIPRRESSDGKKENKKSKRSTERRNSTEMDIRIQSISSPYSKVTEARQDSGAYSSGHGSDENGSVYCRPHLTLLSPRANRPRNRESFSASSGYESASGDNKNYASLSKKRFVEPRKGRQTDERSLLMEKRINAMISRQKKLREELREAKRFLGVADEQFITATSTALQGSTLLEALTQETKILEKRLIACRNHAMIVTCLL